MTTPDPLRGRFGGGRTLAALSALLALAGFFLPWVLVLYGLTVTKIELVPGIAVDTVPITAYFVVLDSSGYDLAFGRISGQKLGEERDVVGNAEYLAFLAGPILLFLVPMAHRALGARDRYASPAVISALALLLIAGLLHRFYFDLPATIRTESEKRVDAEQLEERKASFKVVEEKAVPRHEIGFWMALFGYAGVLSGAILWIREELDKDALEGGAETR